MANGIIVGSPEWWVQTLEARLVQRKKDLEIYDEYYSGKHRVRFQTPDYNAEFGELLADVKDNWCELVVEAVLERMKPLGFRWGDDQRANTKASDIWQKNHMDAEYNILNSEKLIYGRAYVLVDPFVEEQGHPIKGLPDITVEHPDQVIVALAPGSRYKRAAALKIWEDEFGEKFATLYLPDKIYKYKATTSATGSGLILPRGVRFSKWAPRDVEGEDWPLPNPLGVVPMVPFFNRSRMLVEAQSEIQNVIPNQDLINKLLQDLTVASEFGAFVQRYAIDASPEDFIDDDGNVSIRVGNDRILLFPNATTKVGEFSANDLKNIVAAIENRVQAVASQSRTPPHYFYLSGQFPSGESIKSAETGLVSKAYEKMDFDGESNEEFIRLAFRAMGDPLGDDMTAETIWKDPESRTESEMVAAAVQLKGIGIANELLQERAGLTPKQIARNKAILEAERLEAALAQPSAPEPVIQTV